MNIQDIALSYAHKGLSVIPTCADKRPACAWKQFTERIMTDDEIATYFRGTSGIGIVCGKVSGNLELLDFDDGGSAFEPWFCSIPEELCHKLVVETSPSGGKHVYYRVEGLKSGKVEKFPYAVGPNRKLAMKADGHVLIETRGEGGYVKCAPSEGYELMSRNFMQVPTIEPIEQQLMIDAAIALDESGKKVKVKGEGEQWNDRPSIARHGVARPLDSDLCVDIDIAPVLERHGWKKVGTSGVNENWERPGKNERSTSATFNGEVFYVFSSSAAPFEPNRGYNRFQVYALLEHNGDYKAASFALRITGFNAKDAKLASAADSAVRAECSCATGGIPPGGGTQIPRNNSDLCVNTDDNQQPQDPGPLPEELLHVPGFVDLLAEHTLRTAPYPNRPLAFAGALAMLSHLTGRNFRDQRNLRTNIYLLALADSGVGKDFPRKVNMNLANEVGVFGGMADRFASAEGLEDALLVHPSSFFQVDEIDTLFAALNERGDSAMEKIYGSMLQFATSADATYAMRKKAISQVGGKTSKFDKVRARGIREPHLVLLGTGIPKYLWSAISARAMENGLLSRCLVLEAGDRGKAGNPHYEAFPDQLLAMARSLVAHGGFDGLDLEKLEDEPPPYIEPITVGESAEATAKRAEVTEECERLYSAAADTAAKALWTRGAEKTGKLALLYAISEDVDRPFISAAAVEWGWKVVRHLTERTLYQASVYVHDNEFDALRQKAIRYLRDYGSKGSLNHGALLRYMHIDSDTFRRVIETLVQSELITATELSRGGFRYTLV